jgi:3-oxo-5-alpha-steroid 4-dehydrogenase 1
MPISARMKSIHKAVEAHDATVGRGGEGGGSKAVRRAAPDAAFQRAVRAACVLVAVCTAAECLSPTAYGRFGIAADALTFSLDPRLGWWLMELPCSLSFGYFFFARGGPAERTPASRALALVFCLHYLYRGWIFPALIRVHPGGAGGGFSLVPALGGWLVTVLHGFLNARWMGRFGPHLAEGNDNDNGNGNGNGNSGNNDNGVRALLRRPRVMLALLVYYSGLAMTVWHDALLRELRAAGAGKPAAQRYSVPRGGLFEYASSAQYFCELWAWAGFAMLSWGPNGAFIFFVSLGNLVPRAARTHAWYQQHFGAEYPSDRARLVPFLW